MSPQLKLLCSEQCLCETVSDSLNPHWVQEGDICGWQGCKSSLNAFKIPLPLNKPEIMSPSIWEDGREGLMDWQTIDKTSAFWSNISAHLLYVNNLAPKLNPLHFYSNCIRIWKKIILWYYLKQGSQRYLPILLFFSNCDVITRQTLPYLFFAVLQGRLTEPLNTSALESIKSIWEVLLDIWSLEQ